MEYLNLTKEIRKQLNFANQELSKEIKKDKNICNNYKNIGRLYQVVVKYLEYNWHLPLEFEFYKLAARFGFYNVKSIHINFTPSEHRLFKKMMTY